MHSSAQCGKLHYRSQYVTSLRTKSVICAHTENSPSAEPVHSLMESALKWKHRLPLTPVGQAH